MASEMWILDNKTQKAASFHPRLLVKPSIMLANCSAKSHTSASVLN
jgi:hypothetical protein